MFLPFLQKKQNIKPTVLVILDGFGSAPPSQGNAISLANTPNFDSYLLKYPHSELIASGESVGLPTNEVGNTEVGHLTMGAGRTILQDLKRINQSIEKGIFFDNKALVACANHAKANNSRFHILGLASSGSVHSSLPHLFAALQFCKKEGLSNVFLHIFTDGRDAPPKEGLEIIQKVEEQLKILNLGKIASIAGRYYAMDRDKRWDRTAKAYKSIVSGQAIQTSSAEDAVKSAYARGQTDEFIEPTVIADSSGPIGIINDKDSIFFFNYRVDRPRQLSMAFVLPDFERLKRYDFGFDPDTNIKEKDVEIAKTFDREKILKDIFFVTMTEYKEGLPVNGVAFGPELVEAPLPLVLSSAGLAQVHLSESEKERFVTYYFDGLRDEKVEGEDTVIIQSPKVPTYDRAPEMSLQKLVSAFKREINKDKYHFAVINFANPDMVAHTGNLEATVKAVECVDKYLAELVNAILLRNGTVLVTADHGNAEELITFPSSSYFFTTSKGVVNTDHSNNPVPFLIINKSFEGKTISLEKGALADVAPTILGLMGVSKPGVMTGRNLLKA